MADIQSPRLLYIKGTLLLVLGILASAILLIEHSEREDHRAAGGRRLGVGEGLLLRVLRPIERYIDADYKYAGLASFLRYVMRRGKMEEAVGR